MDNLVLKATKAAITQAKCRNGKKVNTDDVLIGILKIISRFDIVRIGHLTIDLQDFQDIIHDTKPPSNKKVVYGSSVNDLFEEAALIAKKDNSLKTNIVHLLVAFSNHEKGVMRELMTKYGFSGKEWRLALSSLHINSIGFMQSEINTQAEKLSLAESNEKKFYSPDEAAAFLSVHVQTIRGYIKSGKLPAMRLAGERALRIKHEDLLALFEPYKPE